MVKSAAELRDLAKVKKAELEAALTQDRARHAAVQEVKVSKYYDEMLKIMENLADKDIRIGWVTVYKIAGEYTEEGSLNAKERSYWGYSHPGLEEAWARLRAELEPQGYHLVRLANRYSTGGYDNPYAYSTEFIVEWDAPWIRNRTAVMM